MRAIVKVAWSPTVRARTWAMRDRALSTRAPLIARMASPTWRPAPAAGELALTVLTPAAERRAPVVVTVTSLVPTPR